MEFFRKGGGGLDPIHNFVDPCVQPMCAVKLSSVELSAAELRVENIGIV